MAPLSSQATPLDRARTWALESIRIGELEAGQSFSSIKLGLQATAMALGAPLAALGQFMHEQGAQET